MSTIDFWLGSKYGSWQYCQKKRPFKKIFPHLCKTSCVIMLIFSHKWEKCPTERNKRLSLWILFINYETLISADWIIENDLYHPMRRSWIFCQTERVGIVFRSLSSCPNSVNSVTCPKLVKKTSGVNHDLLKVSKMTINFDLLNVSKLSSLRVYIYHQSEKLETLNPNSRVNLIQRVLLGTPP